MYRCFHGLPWCLPSFPRSIVLFHGLRFFVSFVYKSFSDAFFNQVNYFPLFGDSSFVLSSSLSCNLTFAVRWNVRHPESLFSIEMFITSSSKYDNIYSFSLSIYFNRELFHCISEDVYELTIRLFYANLYCPIVPKGTEPILRFYVVNVPIKFPVSSLYHMLNLPNEGDFVFLSSTKNFLYFQNKVWGF